MKRIVYVEGGVLCVVTPVINTYPEPEQITEDQAVARAMAKLPATATDVRVLPESAIPATREHRASWQYNAGKTAVVVGPAKSPASVTRRQGMEELIERDLDDDVQAALDAIPGKAGKKARNDFASAGEWRRDWPLIAQMAQQFGWTAAFVDEMFISAAAR